MRGKTDRYVGRDQRKHETLHELPRVAAPGLCGNAGRGGEEPRTSPPQPWRRGSWRGVGPRSVVDAAAGLTSDRVVVYKPFALAAEFPAGERQTW